MTKKTTNKKKKLVNEIINPRNLEKYLTKLNEYVMKDKFYKNLSVGEKEFIVRELSKIYDQAGTMASLKDSIIVKGCFEIGENLLKKTEKELKKLKKKKGVEK